LFIARVFRWFFYDPESLTAKQYLEFVTSIIWHFINVSILVENIGVLPIAHARGLFANIYLHFG